MSEKNSFIIHKSDLSLIAFFVSNSYYLHCVDNKGIYIGSVNFDDYISGEIVYHKINNEEFFQTEMLLEAYPVLNDESKIITMKYRNSDRYLSQNILDEIQTYLTHNLNLIEDRFSFLGYDAIVFTEELNLDFLLTKRESINQNSKIAIITTYYSPFLKYIEQSQYNVKCFVLNEYIDKMHYQLSKVNSHHFEIYKRVFGYDSIQFVGENTIISILKGLFNEKANGGNTLIVSDLINDFCRYEENCYQYYLGMRQFLFELEVIADIPLEIYERLEKSYFLAFVQRFVYLYNQKDWQLIFSSFNPTVQWLIDNGDIDDRNLLQTNRETLYKDRVMMVDDGNSQGIAQFYQDYKNSKWIVNRRFIVLFRAWIMEEICNHFKEILAKKDVELITTNCQWALHHPIYPKIDITSVDMEENELRNINHIIGNEYKYDDLLKKIYGNRSNEYIHNVMKIPPKVEISSGNIKHDDMRSTYLNIFNGQRNTTDTPEQYDNSVYLFGGCVVFGYATSDDLTVPSYLQRRINSILSSKWRVVNYATWGGNIDQTYKRLYDIQYKPGDKVIINYAGYMPLGIDYDDCDISIYLKKVETQDFYFNGIVHCNEKGYEKIAERLFEILDLDVGHNLESEMFYLDNSPYLLKGQETEYQNELDKYLNDIKKKYHIIPNNNSTNGAIIMNCNPFTLGHRYLIEWASQNVDQLYIFVVEENKSFFSFEDRFQLVVKGTADLQNVKVIPSGNLIISSKTFPGYFLKDSPSKVSVDTSLDLTIFAKYIAPALHITKRFVGEEPLDIITNKYNESMKSILPKYGIELVEIERKEDSETVISASRVRALLADNNFDKIQELVPCTTYEYLLKRFGNN